MDEFNCNCGNIDRENFIFAFAMADGEVWTCNSCGDDIITEFEDE